MRLPRARGPLSSWVLTTLSGPCGTGSASTTTGPGKGDLPEGETCLDDDDFQLALWCLYELHYAGFTDVDPGWEWDADLLSVRQRLETVFAEALVGLAPPLEPVPADEVAAALTTVVRQHQSPSVAAYLQRSADREQFRDYLRRRSIYHLKESDPHTFVLPRLRGPAKVALAELQYDEYGGGRPEQLHQQLFADALLAAGLSDEYGHYLAETDGPTLAVNNAMSFFSLHRRWRGASLGHLAAFEATSSLPCRKIANGAERLGFPPAVAAYYTEHVEADAAHEQVALHDICGEAVRAEPEMSTDVLLGAWVCLELDARAGAVLLDEWRRDEKVAG